MNIHRLNEYDNRQPRGNNNNPGGYFPIPGGNNEAGGDPRKDSFWKFTRDFCCPQFSFKSFIFIISIIDLIVYIATLSFGITMNPNELLAPRTDTLDMFGMKVDQF